MFDILIKDGIIIDGTGKEAFRGDVGISDDKIKKIGELHNERGEIEIDASGRIICPGFIDVNNHSDTYWRLFLEPTLHSLIHQGITTIIGGNCGSSLAPLMSSQNIASIQKWIEIEKVNVNWLTEAEFLKVLESKELMLNFGTLAGHGTMRRGILKDEVRSFSAKEINFFHKMLQGALKEGALGMSSGLIYSHARLASTEELIELARDVKKYNGVYTTHIRSEQAWFVNAIEEALQVARVSGVKLHISHLKVMGEKNWHKMEEALALISNAKENGIDVTFDVYPYTNTGSVLYAFLPDWVTEGGKKLMIERLKNTEMRKRIIVEMRESEFEFGKVELAISPLNKTLARRKISDIARSQDKGVEDTIIDVLIASEGRVITSMEVLSEENVRQALLHPLSIASTNGAGYNENHAESGENVHPRNFGAMIKVLEKYVKKEKFLSWETAINKMTNLPAKKFNLKKRGSLKEGNFADILILDQDKIESPATTENPYQYSKGVDVAMVNGKIILQDGVIQEGMNGKIIKS